MAVLLPVAPEAGKRMDDFDRKIIVALQKDGRLQNNDLAAQVHLSQSACLRRTRALEKSGIIERYAAIVSPEKIGHSLVIFANVRLSNQGRENTLEFEEAVTNYANVIECNFMTGNYDYVLKIVAPDISAYEQFLMNKLTKLKCIASVESFVSMRTVKRSAVIPAI
jgi:Lrp/AsnC family transcriptional regulator, leucine-responsive regulatory protein